MSKQRIIVAEIDVNLGKSGWGKIKIMMNTSEGKANDVDVIRSVLHFCPTAIPTVDQETVKEITHVFTNVRKN